MVTNYFNSLSIDYLIYFNILFKTLICIDYDSHYFIADLCVTLKNSQPFNNQLLANWPLIILFSKFVH